MRTVRCWIRICLLTAAVLPVAARGGESPGFVRVHVPHGRLGDIDIGTERYVPMSAREFEAALARVQQGGRSDLFDGVPGVTPLLDVVRYEAATETVGGQVTFAGTATWTVAVGTPPTALPLGGLPVGRARMTTAAGTGDAVVYGRGDGSLAIATPQPGTYSCDWRCRVDRGANGRLAGALPLVPALASTIVLQVPEGLRPVVTGGIVTLDADRDAVRGSGRRWRIDVGPRASVDIGLVPSPPGIAVPRMTTWTSVAIVGRQARVRMLLESDSAWEPEGTDAASSAHFTLAKDPDVVVTAVRMHQPPPMAAEPRWIDEGGGAALRVEIPAACMGRSQAFIVEAVAPFATATMRPLPLLRLAEQAWGGGGIVIQVDPAQVISDLQLYQAAAVTQDAAAGWRAPAVDLPSGAGVQPTLLFIEQQGPQPAVKLAVRPRTADVSVRRVTVIDVSPEAVLARATCDIRVEQGEAFEVRGSVANGWFIDAVEVVAAPVRPPLAAPMADVVAEAPEWRVVREGDENRLRIAFAAAVTPARSVMLRITGHRGGIAAGTPFPAAELDMVRFDGEAKQAALAVRTGPEMTIDTTTEPDAVSIDDPQLASLVEDVGVRVRMPAGSGADDQVLRLARRRPPIDVVTQVRLTARDGQFVESFTFECTPERNEIDSLVVHFSTIMDERLEWSLLPPATSTLVARRLERPERHGPWTGEPIADAWVVEISPPVRQPVTIRAVRTVAFAGTVPVPLAWIDGANRHDGTVTIREAGRFRPRILNHRLAELPPRSATFDRAATIIGEFAFDAGRGHDGDPVPAAELVPGGDAGDDARAWVRREETTIRCHASGTNEYDTSFQIENRGRPSVVCTVPPGLRLHSVSIDGQPVPLATPVTAGADLAIDLPAGRREVEVVVRATAQRSASRGWWTVDLHHCGIDVPVLDRDLQVLLAPDVEMAWRPLTYRVIRDAAAPSGEWLRRLFGASLRPSRRPDAQVSAGVQSASVDAGYREYGLVPVVGRRDGEGLVIVPRRTVVSVAIVAASIAAMIAYAAPTTGLWIVPWLVALAAGGALWAASPFDVVCRAAWWGVLAGIVIRVLLRSRLPVAVVVSVAAFLPSQSAIADDAVADPLRVFITPLDADGTAGETALVPESLFRHLARAESRSAEVRVMACAVVADPAPASGGTESWTMTIDVDADAGTTLVIDQQATGARVVAVRVDGRPMPLRGVETTARIPLTAGGRQRVACTLEPVTVRWGQLDMVTLAVPVAPRASLVVADPLAAVSDCDAAVPGGPFLPAPSLGGDGRSVGQFDISRTATVRVVRPVDARLRLASGVRAAASRNDIVWDLDACRVQATFDVDLPNEIVRGFVVRIDPGAGLDGAVGAWQAESMDEEAVSLVPLGDRRYLVVRRSPEAGGFTARLRFRLPLADPVGVFGIPGAWIEGVAADIRHAQVVPAPDLLIDVRLPDNATSAPRGSDSTLQAVAWRTEAITAAEPLSPDRFDTAARQPAGGLVTVRRRPQQPRATQRLSVGFGAEHIGMELNARIDATATPLVAIDLDVPTAAVIERVELFAERGRGAAGHRRVDISSSRVTPGQVRVVVQQPGIGRYRLEAEARVVGRPALQGTVGIMQAALPGLVPLVVDWNSRDGRGVAVAAAFSEAVGEEAAGGALGDRAASGTIEMTAWEKAISYERGELPDEPVAGGDGAGNAQPPIENGSGDTVHRERVELADVFVAIDERGRCWGSVRFDLVAASPSLRLVLPTGLRLFEVLVDGRPVEAVPQDDGTWQIERLSSKWPRAVVAIFAGDFGSAVGAGKPFQIATPLIVGLRCSRTIWTVRAPRGVSLRVADPARVVDADGVATEREAAFDRLADDFRIAIETAIGADHARLAESVDTRRSATLLGPERHWMPDGRAAAPVTELLHAVVDAPRGGEVVGGLAFRMARQADSTAGSRAVATLLVIATTAAAWRVFRRRPVGGAAVARRLLPAVVGLTAVVWLLLLQPVWPAFMLLGAVAYWAALQPRRRRLRPPSEESTITQFASPPGVALGDLSSTRQVSFSPR